MDRFAELESFVQVAQAGSFTRAAQRLDVAKTVVSDRVARLERRLGAQLLRRTTRRLTLTDIGETFLVRAQRLLADLAEAEVEASHAQTTLTGRLRVAAPLSFGVHQLGALVAEFMRRHPELVVELDLNDRRVDVVGEAVDLALRIGALDDSSLVARRLCRIRHVVAATPAFWDTHGRPRTPAELALLPALAYSRAPLTWRVKGRDGGFEAVRLAPRLTASNGDVLRDAALTDLGFIVEPTFLVHDAIRTGALEPVLTDRSWSNTHLAALWAPTLQLSRRVRALLDFLAERLAGPHPPWDAMLRRHVP